MPWNSGSVRMWKGRVTIISPTPTTVNVSGALAAGLACACGRLGRLWPHELGGQQAAHHGGAPAQQCAAIQTGQRAADLVES